MKSTFEQLIAEAEQQPFIGWDFSFLQGRWEESEPSWSYRSIVSDQVKHAHSLLDMGTGGGEFLFSLQPLPEHTFATEAYQPNVPIAQKSLGPLGVEVVPLTSDEELPFANNTFDLVINRHEAFSAHEVARVLQPNGQFITQQVGSDNNRILNQWLQGNNQTSEPSTWFLVLACQQLEEVGLKISDQKEEFPETKFYDVGAIVYYLKAIPWQIPDFSISQYYAPLRHIHETIQTAGYFATRAHRFIIQAEKS